jgi:hypothetical protein
VLVLRLSLVGGDKYYRDNYYQEGLLRAPASQLRRANRYVAWGAKLKGRLFLLGSTAVGIGQFSGAENSQGVVTLG